MNEKIKNLKEELNEKLKEVNDITKLNDIKNTYLNKKGPLAELSSNLKDLSIEDKKNLVKS